MSCWGMEGEDALPVNPVHPIIQQNPVVELHIIILATNAIHQRTMNLKNYEIKANNVAAEISNFLNIFYFQRHIPANRKEPAALEHFAILNHFPAVQTNLVNTFKTYKQMIFPSFENLEINSSYIYNGFNSQPVLPFYSICNHIWQNFINTPKILNKTNSKYISRLCIDLLVNSNYETNNDTKNFIFNFLQSENFSEITREQRKKKKFFLTVITKASLEKILKGIVQDQSEELIRHDIEESQSILKVVRKNHSYMKKSDKEELCDFADEEVLFLENHYEQNNDTIRLLRRTVNSFCATNHFWHWFLFLTSTSILGTILLFKKYPHFAVKIQLLKTFFHKRTPLSSNSLGKK